MATVIRTPNIIQDCAVLPATVWLIVLRKRFGSRFLGQSYINAVILPIAAIFAPFPFTGKLVWEESKLTLIYAIVAMVRCIYEYLLSKFGPGRANIHSDGTGQPLSFWFRLRLFNNPVSIKRYGEPSIALLLGIIFFCTKWDTFFGGLMLFTAIMCVVIQKEFDEAYLNEWAAMRNAELEAMGASKLQEQVSKEMQGEESGMADTEGYFEIE